MPVLILLYEGTIKYAEIIKNSPIKKAWVMEIKNPSI
jgi:hypothetical protein